MGKGRIKPIRSLRPMPLSSGVATHLTQDEIVQDRMQGFRTVRDRYPIAGAKARVETERSGLMDRQFVITVTVELPDGVVLVHVLSGSGGGDARKATAQAQQFAAEVTRLGAVRWAEQQTMTPIF